MTEQENRDLVIKRLEEFGLVSHDLLTPVYKYRTIEDAKQILTTNKISFPNAEQLRECDKLELHKSILDLDFSDEEIRKHLVYLGINQTVEYFREYMLSDSLEYFRTKVGILSLGKTSTNSPLWERYAEKHKGVCLGFMLPQYQISQHLAFYVNYPPQPKKVKIIDENTGGISSPAIYYWVCTKHVDFKPEEEVRIISENQSGLAEFKKDMLVEIILGRDTSKIEYDLFSQLVIDHGYSVKMNKIVVDDSFFGLQIVDAKTLYNFS